ncbi:MAG: hypothetical protein NZM43_00090 [Saprospiraceae bacterium]|nr:hypothetical protein [Saprospiraceae bacterium]MDW8482700.1 hypothetical protein [Saprospiraceae bacterium]
MIKIVVILLIACLNFPWATSQPRLSGFSRFLGTDMHKSPHLTKIDGGYLIDIGLTEVKDGQNTRVHRIYKISEHGDILDSFRLDKGNRLYAGMPYASADGRIYYLGSYFLTDRFYSDRYTCIASSAPQK